MSDELQKTTFAEKAASSAALLLTRRAVVAPFAAVSTAVVARMIGSSSFGIVSAAFALSGLLSGVADFGFSVVAAREMARFPDRRRSLITSAAILGTVGGVAVAVAMLALGALSGASSDRAIVIYIAAVPLLLTGLGIHRQSFIVLFRIEPIVAIDIGTGVAQAVTLIVIALLHADLFAIAGVMSLGAGVDSLLLWTFGRRLTSTRGVAARRESVLQFFKEAFPQGLAILFVNVYFSVDLVLLGWLVPERKVGQYAAAVRLLGLLIQFPAVVVQASLPALASLREEPDQLGDLLARMWHWLVSFAIPVCVGALIFSGTVVSVAFGSEYRSSADLLRVLAIAGAVSCVTNLFVIVMSSLSVARWQIVQNALAMILNVVGNVVLDRRYGPMAAAWLTVGTELLVAAGSMLAMRRHVSFLAMARVTIRPVLAITVMAVVGFALSGTPAVGIPAAMVGFVVTLLASGGWPDELHPRAALRLRGSRA